MPGSLLVPRPRICGLAPGALCPPCEGPRNPCKPAGCLAHFSWFSASENLLILSNPLGLEAWDPADRKACSLPVSVRVPSPPQAILSRRWSCLLSSLTPLRASFPQIPLCLENLSRICHFSSPVLSGVRVAISRPSCCGSLLAGGLLPLLSPPPQGTGHGSHHLLVHILIASLIHWEET